MYCQKKATPALQKAGGKFTPLKKMGLWGPFDLTRTLARGNVFCPHHPSCKLQMGNPKFLKIAI
jgi:hypothetical protein